MHEITFIRHGESIGNAEGYYQGQSNFSLSEKGKAQAQIVAERLKSEGMAFDQIISSPLERAQETAEKIQDVLGGNVQYDPVWMERDSGRIAGLKREEAEKKYPRPGFISLYKPTGINGESEWEIYLRAMQAIDSILKQPSGKYLVISHGGLLNKILSAVLSTPLQSDFKGVRFKLKNTSITTLTYNTSHFHWDVNDINDHNHVGEISIEEFPYEFTFIRHGESEGNEKDLFQGHADFPLTLRGIKQAQMLADSLKKNGTKFDKIISSPLARAGETANIIANNCGIKLETDSILMEINNGEFAGLHFNEIAQKYPDRPDHKNPYLPTGETGESWWSFYHRAGNALNMLVSQPPGKYLVVSHGGFLNCLLYNILRIPPSLHMNSPIFRFGNTGRAKFGYDPKGDTWYFLNFGMRYHLKEIKE